MKKQLLLVPLLGLFCFTSCNQQSHEQKPVDDATGLARATAVREKEAAVMQEWDSGDPLKIFDIIPHQVSLEMKTIMNGKMRVYSTIPQFRIIEKNYNNVLVNNLKCEINFDTLQFHDYYKDNIGALNDINFFYDEASSTCYTLFNTTKLKISTPASDKEAAKNVFANALKEYANNSIGIMIPNDYLNNLVEKNPDGEYYLLKSYERVNKYFDLFGNKGEYINHQFGSDNENGFSLKNILKLALHNIPEMPNPTDYIGEGYSEGMESAKYNPHIGDIASSFAIPGFGAPDIVNFENNYLTYASLSEKVDVDSYPQSGTVAGAFFQHTTKNSTIEVNEKKINITNPNPGDYNEI